MDDKKLNSNIENHNENKDKKEQIDFSELSGPIMFARADDILFASAMEDDGFFNADIEIDEKVLNSGNKNIEPNIEQNIESKPDSEKPVIPTEQKEARKEIKEEIISQEPLVDNLIDNIDNDGDIKSCVSEEIYEFDLSDPITEPTTVIGGEEDSFDDIPEITQTKSMEKIDNDEPVVVEKAVELETPKPINNLTSEAAVSIPPLAPEQLAPENIFSPIQEVSIPDSNEDEEEDLSFEIDINSPSSITVDKIKQIILEPKILSVDIDVSHEHIILINNSQDFLKYQHNIMDNRCISFFWPCDQNGVIGSRISITTEKEKTFVIDLDKIDIGLMNALLKNPRPIKVFYDAKPIIIWCIKNNLKISHIFDITTALNILSDGLTIDNSLKSIIKRFANQDINSEDISFQDFVSIGKFIFLLRKKLVDCIQELNLIKILNFEQNLLYAIAQSESDGMPYNGNCSKPMSKNVWELVESKYGITSKKELAGAGILFLNKAYLTDKKNLLEVYEYASLESAERTIKNFDSKFVREERIYSSLNYGPSGGIMTKDYSFDGEGLYPFISPDKDSCLVEGKYKNLEVRVVAKLLNNRKLIASFSAEGGPFSYFAGPLFDKAPEDITIDEKFKTKMIFEIVIRNLGERETLYYAWNTSKSFLAEEEIISLKEKFKKVHPDLTRLIKDTQKQAEKDGYVASSLGRVTILNNKSKAFFTKVEMYMHEIFKKALSLSFDDFEAYNTDFTNKIRLCTIYDHIITLECNKKIVNIAIDMLTRNMTTTAAKMLMGIPVLLKVNAVEQWEA